MMYNCSMHMKANPNKSNNRMSAALLSFRYPNLFIYLRLKCCLSLAPALVLTLIHSQNKNIATLMVYGLQGHLSCIKNATSERAN